MYNRPKYSSGFTLTELIISIAIAGMLAGIAIPSFISLITSNRLTTYANELMTALNLARSEAIKRGVQVTVSRKGGVSQEWEGGWDVFVDDDGDDTFSAGDEILRTYATLPSGYTLRTGTSTYQDYASYLPSGVSKRVVGDTFRLCYDTDNTTSRAIIINSIGRARVSTGTVSCP